MTKTDEENTPQPSASPTYTTHADPTLGNGSQPGGTQKFTATQASGAASATPIAQQVKLDTANLKSSYCNMCNANTTREEVVLNFGVNQNWDRGSGGLDVSLEHRIILSSFAAEGLAQMLGKLVEEYESRYGPLQ